LITPAEFREFCAPVVPLLLIPKYVWQNDERFDAGIEIANFSPAALTNATVVWKISTGKREIGQGVFRAPCVPPGSRTQIGRMRQDLSAVTAPAKLKVAVEIAGTAIHNDWPVWVYPGNAAAPTESVAIFQTADENFYAALRAGRKVLLLPTREAVKLPLAAQFTPSFWNPVMFPNQPGSMGAMIDARHPLFAEFPTDPWTNWQWWEMLRRSFAINLDALPGRVTMPFRLVDKFNRNALPAAIFEARVGHGRLLVCTLDISSDLASRIAARQLRRSILDYMSGAKFQPHSELSEAGLNGLFR
jgi:hypothetical protein